MLTSGGRRGCIVKQGVIHCRTVYQARYRFFLVGGVSGVLKAPHGSLMWQVKSVMMTAGQTFVQGGALCLCRQALVSS